MPVDLGDLSQNVSSSEALNPDSMLVFLEVDKLGNPFVERRFQNRMCGAS